MSMPPRIPVFYLAVLLLLVSGCSGTIPDEQDSAHTVDDKGGIHLARVEERLDSSTSIPVAAIPGLANPADRKCVEDGYRLEYARLDDVPVRGYCVNDETGAKCESWAFFRSECSLDGASPGGSPPLPMDG